MSVKVAVAGTEEERRPSYRLRFETMCRDLGWLPAQDYAVPEEKDEYDAGQSIIFLAFDDDDNPVGTTRIIMPGNIPLPIEKHFELYPKELVESVHGKIVLGAEVSRFIVPQHQKYKKHEITQALCMALLGKLLITGASHAYISADHRFFRLLMMMGFNFAPIGEPKVYMGSKTIPAITNLIVLEDRLRSEKPGLYALLMSGSDRVLNAV
jgi:N-acyl-L-homoserine lactone synthetase